MRGNKIMNHLESISEFFFQKRKMAEKKKKQQQQQQCCQLNFQKELIMLQNGPFTDSFIYFRLFNS